MFDRKPRGDFVYELVKAGCEEYMKTDDYQKGIYKDPKYEACCVKMSFCSFYVQTWFYIVCAAVLFLLIIASIVGSWCCCCRRGRGGGGMESIESEASEPSENPA